MSTDHVPSKSLSICIAMLLLAGCDIGNKVCEVKTVETLGDCSNAHSNVLASYKGECRVVLSDGSRINVARPAMVGDRIEFCHYDGPDGYETVPRRME
jgi:hypothetical protein